MATEIISKVYVATKFGQVELARAAMMMVLRAGHAITYDWTHERETCGAIDQFDIPLDRAVAENVAQADLRGVMDADWLVVLTTETGGRGMFTELGLAYTAGVAILAVGPHLNNIFYYLSGVIRVPTMEEAIKFINKHPRGV